MPPACESNPSRSQRDQCTFRMLEHLPALGVAPCFAALGQFPNLFRITERELSWQRRLYVCFEALYLPAVAEKERYVDAVARPVVARHVGIIREENTKGFHSRPRVKTSTPF